MGVPYNDIFAGSSRPYTVRDNPVIGKIPSANHITGPRRGHSAPSVLQKRLLIAMGHQFRAGFTIGIRIIPIQGITFPVTILPFPVLIHLIRGHIQERTHAFCQPHTFQHIHGPHYVGLISIHRILIRIPDNWLCRQMKHNLGPYPVKDLPQMLQVPYVPNHAVHTILQPRNLKQARIRRRT